MKEEKRGGERERDILSYNTLHYNEGKKMVTKEKKNSC
jgi:hypothetical protein